MDELKANKCSSFQGELGAYDVVTTEDGSITLHSAYFDENCHSLSGAAMETQYNYLEGCLVDQRIRSGEELTVFEVGLGLGIGPKITIDYWLKHKKASLTFISTELDRALVEFAKETFKESEYFQKLQYIEQDGLCYFQYTDEKLNFIILIGDARKTTIKAFEKGLISPVKAIYQDAFSPKKNPALWTVEWFLTLRDISHSKVLLSTYSSAKRIRKSLIQAGFHVQNREGFGAKKVATLATLEGVSDKDILTALERSPVCALVDGDLA